MEAQLDLGQGRDVSMEMMHLIEGCKVGLLTGSLLWSVCINSSTL